uniref:Uncharacterized protein n=1 Tax=Rhizophora mucronata TaxID=61149 RepID=A0A2P2PLT8_RHIMU
MSLYTSFSTKDAEDSSINKNQTLSDDLAHLFMDNINDVPFMLTTSRT